MIPKRGRARQGAFQRRPLVALLGLAAEPLIEIFLEIGLELAFLPVGGRVRLIGSRLGNVPLGLLGPDPRPGFLRLRLLLLGLLLDLQHGIVAQLFVDDLDELKVGHGQELDGLLQGRRQDELLDLPLVEALFHGFTSPCAAPLKGRNLLPGRRGGPRPKR